MSTRKTEIISICSVYLEYDIYFAGLCTVSTIVRPISRHKTLADGPTSGRCSKSLSLGTTRALKALTVFREYVTTGSMHCEYSQYLDIILYCGYCLHSKHFVLCDTAGTYLLVLSWFCTAHTLRILNSCTFSLLAICEPPQYSLCFGLQYSKYSQYSDYELFSSMLYCCILYRSVLGLRMFSGILYCVLYLCKLYFTLSAKKLLYFLRNIFCMCWILLSRSHSITSQP